MVHVTKLIPAGSECQPCALVHRPVRVRRDPGARAALHAQPVGGGAGRVPRVPALIQHQRRRPQASTISLRGTGDGDEGAVESSVYRIISNNGARWRTGNRDARDFENCWIDNRERERDSLNRRRSMCVHNILCAWCNLEGLSWWDAVQ